MVDKKQLKLVVMDGPDRGSVVTLKKGTCKVIGREIKTDTFEVDRTHLQQDLEIDTRFKEEEIEKINRFLHRESTAPSKSMGRSLDNPYKRTYDFILSDLNISRVHAMVFFGEYGAGIIDLASTNGTNVNGKRIDMAELANEDAITLGQTKIQIVL